MTESDSSWEYRLVGLDSHVRDKTGAPRGLEELNRLGTEGWEAVGVTLSGVTSPRYQVLLKRQQAN
jgi:sirohydrochlorin ferrochelatase